MGKIWNDLLKEEKEKKYMQELIIFLKEEYSNYNIFPLKSKIFKSINSVDYNKVKVVILGQDPYHSIGQANGLAFAVENNISKKPPSLLNIFHEIENDLNITINKTFSSLEGWAKQGVLLLNAVLTVRENQPTSHKNKGWEIFTSRIIKLLVCREEPIIFLLWGKDAKIKIPLIEGTRHKILSTTHPSPFSARYGFFGSKHFSKTNSILNKYKIKEIDWSKIE